MYGPALVLALFLYLLRFSCSWVWGGSDQLGAADAVIAARWGRSRPRPFSEIDPMHMGTLLIRIDLCSVEVEVTAQTE